jgi:peptide/nickel transport system substrate-binding protein/oligopeptide transport system substrate-binding protein
LTWTFHTNSHAHWSDGIPLTANSYAYSLNRTLDPCTHSEAAQDLLSIRGAAALHTSACPVGADNSAHTLIGSSITAVDARTLQVQLSAPDPSFLFALTTPGAWAVPEHLITADPDHWTERLTDGDGFGGNQFKLTKWDHQGHLDFAANENYWGDASMKPILQHVNVTLYRTGADVTRSYAAGIGDVAIAPAGNPGDVRKLPGYQAIRTLDLTYLIPNWGQPPFDDLRMRQAFALSIDRHALLRDAARDDDLPTAHIVPSGLPEYNRNLVDPGLRAYDDTLSSAPARALALARSYADAACGGMLTACLPITLTVASTPDQQTLAQALVAQWRQVLPGLTISVHAVNPATTDQTARSAQLTLTTQRADPPDTLGQLLSRLRTGGAENLGAASVPEADSAVDRAATTNIDASSHLDQVMEAEQLYVTSVAWIPLAQGALAVAMRPNVGRLTFGANQHISLTTWQRAYVTRD